MSRTDQAPRIPAARSRYAALALLLLFGLGQACPAQAAFPKTVRWRSSPLKSPTGQSLPPAATYEVWLAENTKPEAMVAVVTDTTCTIQVTPGATYVMRVRGVSAQGQKSAFSAYSDPWHAPGASPVPLDGVAAFGPVSPNPFNARTAISYLVPENLSAGAPLELDIYDVRGRHVHAFALSRDPGAHEAVWNGEGLHGERVPAGIYLARYVCGDFRSSVKLALVS